MKIFILFFTLGSVFSQNCIFYNTILSDFKDKSYKISLKIETKSYKGSVIIENDDLFYYLNKTKNYSKKKYIRVMKDKLYNNSYLVVNDDIFIENEFIKLKSDDTIENDYLKGKVYFLNKYFNDKVLKNNYSINEELAIIDQLFKFKILSFSDDETGILVIINPK